VPPNVGGVNTLDVKTKAAAVGVLGVPAAVLQKPTVIHGVSIAPAGSRVVAVCAKVPVATGWISSGAAGPGAHNRTAGPSAAGTVGPAVEGAELPV
jgi:hypothetical protein